MMALGLALERRPRAVVSLGAKHAYTCANRLEVIGGGMRRGCVRICAVMSLVSLAALTLGCGGEASESSSRAGQNGAEAAPAPSAAQAQSPEQRLARGRELYTSRCATCHGEGGAGDGPGGAAFNPPPRNLADASWQASVDDERIRQAISYGGAAVGVSPMMPSQPDLANRPDDLSALVAFVRSISK